MYNIYTGWPVKHGPVFLVPNLTFQVYATVHMYNGQVTFYKVPEKHAHVNWSPCMLPTTPSSPLTVLEGDDIIIQGRRQHFISNIRGVYSSLQIDFLSHLLF